MPIQLCESRREKQYFSELQQELEPILTEDLCFACYWTSLEIHKKKKWWSLNLNPTVYIKIYRNRIEAYGERGEILANVISKIWPDANIILY